MGTAAPGSRRPGGRWRTDILALLVVGAICAIVAAATAVAGNPGGGSGSYKETSSGDNEKNGDDHRHTICHATGSSSNPYVVITPSVSAVYHGHIAHQHTEDIIPPFVYKGQTYSQNWNATGQEIYANGCRPKTPPPPVDVCPNIDGVQTSVPPGMIVDERGKCVTPPPPVDVCPNIEGVQTSVPPGMVKDASGNCVTPPVDVCPNIAGVQTSVPPGMVKDASGNCVTPPPPVDVCPNIQGVQTSVPPGMVKDASGNCVTPPPPPTDECPNIDGVQTSVPPGMVKDASGNCVTPPPTDVCPNVPGVQETVPLGMIKDASGNCVTPPGPAPPVIDLLVRKVDTPDPVSIGAQLRYTITVANRSGVRATGVVVEDVMPGSIRITSVRASQGSCTTSGARITCRLGNLRGGETARITVRGIPGTAGTIVNLARVHGNEPDPVPGNNTTTEQTRVVAPFQPPAAPRCDSVTVGRRTITVGTRTTLRIFVKAKGRALARVRVRVRGAGIDARTLTNRKGVAVVSVRARRPGIVSITVANQGCQRRIGAIAGGQPDLTG